MPNLGSNIVLILGIANLLADGLEMLLVGGLAASVAYVVGALLRSIVG